MQLALQAVREKKSGIGEERDGGTFAPATAASLGGGEHDQGRGQGVQFLNLHCFSSTLAAVLSLEDGKLCLSGYYSAQKFFWAEEVCSPHLLGPA